MATLFRQAISWLYTTLAVTILGVWTLLVLAGVGVTAVDSNPGLLQLIALPSLLTFLVAKLVVAASPPTAAAAVTGQPPGSGDLATWLATADHGSPHGALVLFLFSVAWLLHLVRVVFALFLVVLMGAFFVFAATLDAADKGDKAEGGQGLFDDEGARQNFSTALAEFEEQAGFGFGDYLVENPWVVFQAVVALWSAFGLLMMYVAAYAFGAIRKVLTTPLEAWARGQGSRAAGAPVVVVEKERVRLPAETQAAN
ncbi:hypothetical protein Ct61P_12758 [Colletotrichum tofieldiae]|nr:hypothetical protein Ct61P_12758 [Colletotrichum tofieldiae]